jgi:SAM-dependent methyltransferase
MQQRGKVDLATADGQDRYVPSETRDILSAGHEGVYEWAVENLVEAGDRFLDLGCGTGYGAALVTAAGGSYDGADASPAAVEYAVANYGSDSARFFVADLMEPLPPDMVAGSYDVVFSSEVLEHVIDPFTFVRTMSEFVRDDGTCFVGTPNRSWSKENMPGSGLLALSHVMEFTAPALLGLLGTYFDDVRILHRVFPLEAIRSTMLPANRTALAKGALTFAREVVPERLTESLKRMLRNRVAEQWTSQDITWLEADDPRLDATRAVGLCAVCKAPKR